MGLLSFLGGKDPSKAAQPYLQQITPMAEQRLNPYIQQGQQAAQSAQGQFRNLSENPASWINELLGHYTPSAGFDFKKDQALKAMRNSAAAGGYSGTEADQIRQGELASALSSQDMYDWLDRVMRSHETGLSGQTHFADTGYNANANLTDIAGNSLQQQGGLAYQGAAQKTKNIMDMIKLLVESGTAMATGGLSSLGKAAGGGQPAQGSMSPMQGTANMFGQWRPTF